MDSYRGPEAGNKINVGKESAATRPSNPWCSMNSMSIQDFPPRLLSFRGAPMALMEPATPAARSLRSLWLGYIS